MSRNRPPSCRAASPDGWLCELPKGHEGQHDAGDVQWDGNTRHQQTRCRVLSVLLNADDADDWGMTADAVAQAAGLHIDTARGHLNGLRDEKMATRRSYGRGYLWAAS